MVFPGLDANMNTSDLSIRDTWANYVCWQCLPPPHPTHRHHHLCHEDEFNVCAPVYHAYRFAHDTETQKSVSKPTPTQEERRRGRRPDPDEIVVPYLRVTVSPNLLSDSIPAAVAKGGELRKCFSNQFEGFIVLYSPLPTWKVQSETMDDRAKV